MSKDNVEANDVEVAEMYCASCGITEVDDIKLNKCNGPCGLARCDKCQREHLPPKYEQLRRKRAAELRDEMLFRQPESSHLGDCPICCLPLSLIFEENTLCSCCSTTICNGCDYANQKRELEKKLEPSCPFCRRPVPKKEEENLKFQTNTMKRAKANDPVATIQLSKWHYNERDYVGAFEYILKAAELGDVDAYAHLSHLYREGLGVEKDEKKGLYYLEEAAIAGHPTARYNLAGYEWDNERYDRAVKHWIIAANLGYDDSIQRLKDCYKDGHVSKEDFAGALRAHQAAVNATKSPQRETAAKADK